MKKTLLTIAATIAITTSAQASEPKMQIQNFYESGAFHIAEVELTDIPKGTKLSCMMTDSAKKVIETQSYYVSGAWDMKKVLFVRTGVADIVTGVNCRLH